MAHVKVQDLSVVFKNNGRDVAAVENVSFALERGETLGIVGESGSGKSTVARALLGFARPGARFAQGAVQVGPADVLGLQGGRLAILPRRTCRHGAAKSALIADPAYDRGRAVGRADWAACGRDRQGRKGTGLVPDGRNEPA